jgi:hypothetical protein
MYLSAAAGVCLGFLIGWAAQSFATGFWAVVICGFGGVFICHIVQNQMGTNTRGNREDLPTKPLDPSSLNLTRIADTSPTPPPAPVEERLKRLDDLHAEKLISEQEYQAKRQQLLSEL